MSFYRCFSQKVGLKMREQVIVYALGDYWKENKSKIIEKYDIIACSDQNLEAAKYGKNIKFILPEKISDFSYDKIIIGCKRLGVREIIALKYNIPFDKIVYYNEEVNNLRKKNLNRMQCHKEKLTIVIPTYNRKERLKRTLNILEQQSDSDFKVIIMDNCSNYNIHYALEKRNKNFQEKVTIIHNKRNIGMAGNLANIFIQETNGWIWTLADDDIPSIYAVEDIYSEIEKAEKLGVVSFSIHDFSNYLINEFIDIEELHELIKFYRMIKEKGNNLFDYSGDFIYLSNKVYNTKYIKKYYEDIFYYTYSGVPHLIPILFMLNDNIAKMRISNKKIVAYDMPDNDHWDWLKVVSGMRIITDLQLDLNEEETAILYNLLMVDYKYLIENIKTKNIKYVIKQLDKLYNEIYKYFLSEEEKKDYLNILRNKWVK